MAPKKKSAKKVSKQNSHTEFSNRAVLVMFVLVIIASTIGIVLFSSGI